MASLKSNPQVVALIEKASATGAKNEIKRVVNEIKEIFDTAIDGAKTDGPYTATSLRGLKKNVLEAIKNKEPANAGE